MNWKKILIIELVVFMVICGFSYFLISPIPTVNNNTELLIVCVVLASLVALLVSIILFTIPNNEELIILNWKKSFKEFKKRYIDPVDDKDNNKGN